MTKNSSLAVLEETIALMQPRWDLVMTGLLLLPTESRLTFVSVQVLRWTFLVCWNCFGDCFIIISTDLSFPAYAVFSASDHMLFIFYMLFIFLLLWRVTTTHCIFILISYQREVFDTLSSGDGLDKLYCAVVTVAARNVDVSRMAPQVCLGTLVIFACWLHHNLLLSEHLSTSYGTMPNILGKLFLTSTMHAKQKTARTQRKTRNAAVSLVRLTRKVPQRVLAAKNAETCVPIYQQNAIVVLLRPLTAAVAQTDILRHIVRRVPVHKHDPNRCCCPNSCSESAGSSLSGSPRTYYIICNQSHCHSCCCSSKTGRIILFDLPGGCYTIAARPKYAANSSEVLCSDVNQQLRLLHSPQFCLVHSVQKLQLQLATFVRFHTFWIDGVDCVEMMFCVLKASCHESCKQICPLYRHVGFLHQFVV
eukprot:284816870_6